MPEGPRLWPGESTAQAFQGRHMDAPGAGGRACPRRCVVHEHARRLHAHQREDASKQDQHDEIP